MTARKHKDFIPPWQDAATLCAHLCISPNTLDAWVARGILPAPRDRGGKRMWKWAEVDDWMTDGPPVPVDGRITDNVRRALAEKRAGY